jgi:amino-acid N-acetyltransferase
VTLSKSASAEVETGATRFVLRPASQGDDPTLRALLESAKLPFDDVSSERQEFIVAISEGQVVGCVGLEMFGDAGLLRSLAVAERLRGAGLGRVLYNEIVARAKDKGLRRLFLLTTTAAPFFARRGFQNADRAEAPEAMTKSPQFASLCPSTAACLALSL